STRKFISRILRLSAALEKDRNDSHLTLRSAARGEQREPMARCSVKFDARLILAAVIIVAYRMTSSARWSSHCGIVRRRAFAALRLITSSNFVGCSTGRSVGLVPLRILST